MRTMLRTALKVLAALLVMAIYYLAVILSEPQEDTTAAAITPRQDQPLISTAQESVGTTEAALLSELTQRFPAPALLPATSTFTFVSGACYDVPFEDGFGRLLTLNYQADDATQITLTSIYPARALSLLDKGDYRLSGNAGPLLAGIRSIRLETTDTIRLCAQGEEAVYVLTTPQMNGTTLSSLSSLLGLGE